jgi:tRNA dimethylallyltransferase
MNPRTPHRDGMQPANSGVRPAQDAHVLALFGPTAAGKSALAHAAALALGGEIVVADPFQRYRGLEIAADSPRPAERAEVAYHGVLDLELDEASSAAGFAHAAHAAIDGILARGRVPIVAGGTGLYLRAALADLDFPAPSDPVGRAEVEALVAADPTAAADELRTRDPEAAARVDLANPRRLARALELARSGGVMPPSAPLWSEACRHPTLLVAVTRPREVLDRLIAIRVRRELDEGLVAELEAAIDGPGLSREAAQVIGVKEVMAMRSGALAPDALEERLAARTRRLARRQLAWLRKTPGAVELDLGEAPAADALPRLLDLWRPPGRAVAGIA